ncbi:carbohydrate ABC transporter permease, partial [Micromonospora fluostatini]
VFFWMLTSSFKQQVDIYTIPPKWFDFTPTLDNYREALTRTPFARYMTNSLVVATCSSLLGLVIGVPAAYSIARYRQTKLSLSLLTARLLPGVAYLVPFFVAFTALRMVGTYPALILSHVIITFPLTVFIMVNFFAALPQEVYDAAEVDGCGKLETFARIAVPLTRPGMLTAGILAFIFSWNDFKMALILSDGDSRTLPVAVFNFVHEASLDWGPMMAYASIIMLPVFVLTLAAQRHIVTGMTMGSVK